MDFNLKTIVSFLFLIGLQFYLTNGSIHKIRREVGESQVQANSSDDPLGNRFGFNFNRGQAQAVGPNGGFSNSQAATYNQFAGIQGPGGRYQPLFQKNGGYSNSFSTPGGPQTWANSHNHGRPGQIGGGSNAGFSGGRGNAQADSFSVVHRIPLNPFDGTVLLINLPNKSNSTSEENATRTDEQPIAEKIEEQPIGEKTEENLSKDSDEQRTEKEKVLFE